MNKTVLFIFFLSVICSAQENTIDYIVYSNNTYYEILKNKKSVTVVKYYLNESRLKRDTLNFTSFKEAQSKLDVEILLNTRRLQKESVFFENKYPEKLLKHPNFGSLVNTEKLPADLTVYRKVGLDFKTNTDTLYTFQLYENGNKELWYLSGDDSLELYDRFWCKAKEQPSFIPIKNEQFDVILVVKNNRLSLLYYDKKKGIQGNFRL